MSRKRHPRPLALAALVGTLGLVGCAGQLDEGPEIGGPEMPLRYVGPPLPEPDRPDGGIRPVVGVQDGRVVGIWKGALAALSEDEGRSWSRPVRAPASPKPTQSTGGSASTT